MTAAERINIEREIEALIAGQMDRGEDAQASWLVHALISQHQEIEGADKDWYVVCAYGHGRNVVRRVLHGKALNPDDDLDPDAQQMLPGFKRIRRAYLIKREGEEVVVPFEKLSAQEIRAKVAELRNMAVGCNLHADELERYADAMETRAAS